MVKASAVAFCFGSPLKRKTIQPPSLFDSSVQGFSHGVLVEGGKKILFISGEFASDKKAEVVGGNLEEQLQRTLDNIGAVLKEAGADWKNVVKATVYVTDIPDSIEELVKIAKRYFKDAYPVGTLVGVKGLGIPGQLVEIDAIAVI